MGFRRLRKSFLRDGRSTGPSHVSWYAYVALFLCLVSSATAFGADWGQRFGFAGDSIYSYAVVADGSGNIYQAGTFGGATATFGGVTLTKIGVEDMFVVKMDSSGTVLWAKNFGGSGAITTSYGLAVDGTGNVYLAGVFSGADLTTPALTLLGGADAIAIKLTSAGATTWAKNFGGTNASATGYGIAVDAAGNVYLGGSFDSANLTTPALTLIGVADAFAIKLDSTGATTWSKNYGGTGGAYVTGSTIAVDGSGNVYLGGSVQDANLTTPALTLKGLSDAFAMKLSSAGATTWSKSYGGAGSIAYGYGLAVDGSGNVYFTGTFHIANMTTPALTLVGDTDTFAIKLTSAGATTWSKKFGGAGAVTYANGIALDSTANVYLGGFFQLANLTTPALTQIGPSDAFAIKLTSAGATTWAKNFGGANAVPAAVAVAVDASGNVYLGGSLSGGNLTTPALTTLGNSDSLMIRLDSSGNTTLAKNFGGATSGSNYAYSVAIDDSGSNYVVGTFDSASLVVGGTTLTRIGAQDVLVAKLDAVGNILWAKNFGGAGVTAEGKSISADSSGNVYVSGYWTGANLTTPALTLIGTTDAFAIKLNSSGTTTWAKNFGGTGAATYGTGITTDASGNVYLGGHWLAGNLTTPALASIGNQDTFAIKLNSSGTTTWAKSFGGTGAAAYSGGIAADASGNVYLGGYWSGANLTAPALTRIGSYDAFAIKLDSTGTTTWGRNFGGATATAVVNGIGVDTAGNVYLGGIFNTSNLTTPALTRIGSNDVFAIKLDANGSTTWAKNYGGSGVNMSCNGIAVDRNSNVYLGGNWNAGNLTTPPLTLIGNSDGFAIKVDSSGATTWAKNYGAGGSTVLTNGIATDGHGNVLLAGGLSGGITTPTMASVGVFDLFVISTQLYNTSCAVAGKVTFDSSNNVMVFCDGSSWQSMNNGVATTCPDTTNGKFRYDPNGGSSDFVWYGGSCRSAKSTTTYGACAVNGKFEWDATNSVVRGCINGTWTSLLGR